MSTSLLNTEVLLSKQMGDYWSSTTTSNGAAGGTTVIDTQLSSYPNAWIQAQSQLMWDMITSGTYDEEERKISSLDNSTGTLTVIAHTGQIASSVTYRIHRLFKASDKRIAIIDACKAAYPYVFDEVWDESMVSGNWLKDGSFETWTTSSNLTYWTEDTLTATKTTTAGLYKHGSTSAKLDTAAGNIEQSISEWDDLKYLAGKRVKFSVQAWCDTASCLRISVYDGTTTSYSDYHTGDSAWTENSDPLEVEVDIQDNPTDISFKVLHENASGTSYVDDARVISIKHPRIYIGDLSITENMPHQVLLENGDYSTQEPWQLIRGIRYDQANGYMYLPDYVPADYRLRIIGTKYLDFYDTNGDSGTDWDDTCSLNSPQIEILVAQAIIYLYRTKILPTQNVGDTQQALSALQYWESELQNRKYRYGMEPYRGTVNFANSR